MRGEVKNKKLAAKLDAIIILAVKIWLGVSVVALAGLYWLAVDKIWLASLIIVSGLACFLLMSVREVITGKIYASNAKKRRKRYLPFLYA
jgi:uncharacterized membrane protein (DUF441 family)